MTDLRISWLITGVRAACVDACLASLFSNPLADEMLFVHDDTGRSLADPGKLSSVRLADYPGLRVAHNPRRDDWSPCNQTANVGIAAATCPWVVVTHEDMLWPRFAYPFHIRNALYWLATQDFTVQGKRVIGVQFPTFEYWSQGEYPAMLPDPRAGACPVGLTQWFMAHTATLSKDALAEVGPFSETDGVWWDTSFREELLARDWWVLYCRWPAPYHLGTRSLMANDWAHKWQKAPAWGHFEQSFERRYGRPPLGPPKTYLPLPEAAHLA